MWLADVLYNQYLLALGEFQTLDSYTEGSQPDLVVLMFFCATFFTQITMLNMLIAIMSDVFERETEMRDVKKISTKLEILAEQAPVLSQTSKTEELDVYMIVIEPIRDEDYEEENWQGTINELSHITEKQIAALKKSLDKRTDKLQNFIQKRHEENN